MSQGNDQKSGGSERSNYNRRTVLRSVGGAAAATGIASASAAAGTGDQAVQLNVKDTETAFEKLSEAPVQALLEKLKQEGYLPDVTADTADVFPPTTLETDTEGGVGRFETGDWFGEQHVFLAYLEDAEVQVIVSDRGYPSAVVDPVDTDDQRVVSVKQKPDGRSSLSSRHFQAKPAQISCDEECWCDGCFCCPLNDIEKRYCRNVYQGDCIVTNRCECE